MENRAFTSWLFPLVMVVIVLLPGCILGGRSRYDEVSSGSGSSNDATLSGVAQKGNYVSGTAVSVYKVSSNGTVESTASWNTTVSSSGLYSVSVGTYTGAVEIRVSGTFINELDGTTKTSTTPLKSLYVLSGDGGTKTVNVNTITTLSYKKALALMASGTVAASAITAANTAVANLVGLSVNSNPAALKLTDTDSDSSKLLEFSAAILHMCAVSLSGADPVGLISALADNISTAGTLAISASAATALGIANTAAVTTNFATTLSTSTSYVQSNITTIRTNAGLTSSSSSSVFNGFAVSSNQVTVGSGAHSASVSSAGEVSTTTVGSSETPTLSATIVKINSPESATFEVGLHLVDETTLTGWQIRHVKAVMPGLRAEVSGSNVSVTIPAGAKIYWEGKTAAGSTISGTVTNDIVNGPVTASGGTLTFDGTNLKSRIQTVMGTEGNTAFSDLVTNNSYTYYIYISTLKIGYSTGSTTTVVPFPSGHSLTANGRTVSGYRLNGKVIVN